MKKHPLAMMVPIFCLLLASCASSPPGQYNTQVGAAVGAGTGALIGHAIGGNAEGTLLGLAAGTIVGALVGNAVDQQHQAAVNAAAYGKPVIYYDENGRAVEAIPEASADPNCRKVRKRIWENGKLVKETVEEVCSSAPAAGYVYPPPVYYGWWGWPTFSFRIGRPYYHRHYWHRPYGRYHGWHR